MPIGVAALPPIFASSYNDIIAKNKRWNPSRFHLFSVIFLSQDFIYFLFNVPYAAVDRGFRHIERHLYFNDGLGLDT